MAGSTQDAGHGCRAELSNDRRFFQTAYHRLNKVPRTGMTARPALHDSLLFSNMRFCQFDPLTRVVFGAKFPTNRAERRSRKRERAKTRNVLFSNMRFCQIDPLTRVVSLGCGSTNGGWSSGNRSVDGGSCGIRRRNGMSFSNCKRAKPGGTPGAARPGDAPPLLRTSPAGPHSAKPSGVGLVRNNEGMHPRHGQRDDHSIYVRLLQ